ncbi:hypothetical protein D9758_001517 [Tetrapyrgos nigripes]|uniref:L-dopachrome isomerase n=1 Tax=Tetrapyrgos nigripes TaxID=182062 RepID=A0A8H5LXD9_9AGAR|nr:hypothetical protein D9758_001517 [Tetrapyrgos nigripes]
MKDAKFDVFSLHLTRTRLHALARYSMTCGRRVRDAVCKALPSVSNLQIHSPAMPALELKTNVKIPNLQEYIKDFSKVGQNFHAAVSALKTKSKLSATTLGKPEEYICVSVLQDQPMSFKGTFEPAFLLNVTSLDNINPDANAKYSAVFFEHFKKTLSIEGDRGYISFIDPGRANFGLKGTTAL